MQLGNDDGSLPERVHSAVNYLPGMQGQFLPDGLGTFRLNRNFAIVGNDLHYGPPHRDTVDRSKIRIYFSKHAPKRPVNEIMLGTNGDLTLWVVKPFTWAYERKRRELF
jgi:hypothetical protein